MADGDALPQGAPGSEEPAPVAQSGLSDIEATLREEIMADVEARLSQKADSLWKRGQAELGKLQQDRKEVATNIAGILKNQESLISEQTAMRGALLDIATKMEFVALEMREALRAVGKLDGPAANGGLLPEAALAMPPALPVATELMAELAALGFPPQGLEVEGAPPGLAIPGLALHGLCTPPRIATQMDASPALLAAMHPIAPLPGSPAVLLSLASALPSAPATSPSTASPPIGATRLHIADCLEINGSSPILLSHIAECDAYDPSPHKVWERTSGILGSPVSTAVNGSSSSGSPSRAEVGSPISGDVAAASFGCELRADGAFKAPGGTLRAEAPAFVPGGIFAN